MISYIYVVKVRRLLSENLKRTRKAASFTQEELAEAAGISLRMLQDVEGESAWPSPETIEKIVRALGIQEFELFAMHEKVSPTISHLTAAINELNNEQESLPKDLRDWIRINPPSEGQWANVRTALGIPSSQKKAKKIHVGR